MAEAKNPFKPGDFGLYRVYSGYVLVKASAVGGNIVLVEPRDGGQPIPYNHTWLVRVESEEAGRQLIEQVQSLRDAAEQAKQAIDDECADAVSALLNQ